MTQLIVMPTELGEQCNTEKIKGIPNVSPVNTVRFNVDKEDHIKSVLGVEDISEYFMDISEVKMWEEEL